MEAGLMERAFGKVFAAYEGEDEVEARDDGAAKGHCEESEGREEPEDLLG